MKAIVAISENWAIGNKGGLPWPKIKEDFQWFKEFTMGKVVVVGHKTFKSLPPLKGRTVYCLKRGPIGNNGNPEAPVNFVDGDWLLEAPTSHQDWVICGGASVYGQLLNFCEELYVTHVKGAYEADTYFPFSSLQISQMFPYKYYVNGFDGHKVIKYSKT